MKSRKIYESPDAYHEALGNNSRKFEAKFKCLYSYLRKVSAIRKKVIISIIVITSNTGMRHY